MGFFDVLKSVAKAVESVSNAVNNNQSNDKPAASQPQKPAQTSKPASRPSIPKVSDKKTKQHYFDFANAQQLPEKVFTGTYFNGDENGNDYQIDYSFKATEDFEESDSGALEIHTLLCYHGNGDDVIEFSYCPPSIMICHAPENQVMNPVEKCLAGESPDNVMMFLKLNDNPIAVCKAKLKAFGQIYYLYAVKRGFDKHLQYIGACYGVDAVGTRLEQILIDAVDNIIVTYKETKSKV